MGGVLLVAGVSAMPLTTGKPSYPGNTPTAPVWKGETDGHRHPVGPPPPTPFTDLLPNAGEMNSPCKHGASEIGHKNIKEKKETVLIL